MWAMYVACLSLLLPSSNCLATFLLPAAAWAPSPRKLSLLMRHKLCALMKEVERYFLTWLNFKVNVRLPLFLLQMKDYLNLMENRIQSPLFANFCYWKTNLVCF
jgi:hypothetical protein